MESKHSISKTVILPLLIAEYLVDSKEQNKTMSESLGSLDTRNIFLTKWFNSSENITTYEKAWNSDDYVLAAKTKVQIKIKSYDLTMFTKEVPESAALAVVEYLRQF